MGFTRTNKGCTLDSSPDPSPGDQDRDTTSAELAAILIPVIGGSVLTLSLALLCCVWANKAQIRLRKDIKKELPAHQEEEETVVVANGHAKTGLEFSQTLSTIIFRGKGRNQILMILMFYVK